MAKQSGSVKVKAVKQAKNGGKLVKGVPNPGGKYECAKHGLVEPYVCKTYRTCKQCAKDRRAAYQARKKAGQVGIWTAHPDYWTKGPGKGQDGAREKAAEAKARTGVEFAWTKPEGNKTRKATGNAKALKAAKAIKAKAAKAPKAKVARVRKPKAAVPAPVEAPAVEQEESVEAEQA